MTLRERTGDKQNSCLLNSLPFNRRVHFHRFIPKGEWWRLGSPSSVYRLQLAISCPHHTSYFTSPSFARHPPCSKGVPAIWSTECPCWTTTMCFQLERMQCEGCVFVRPTQQTVKSGTIPPELVVLSIVVADDFFTCNLHSLKMRIWNHTQQKSTGHAHCPYPKCRFQKWPVVRNMGTKGPTASPNEGRHQSELILTQVYSIPGSVLGTIWVLFQFTLVAVCKVALRTWVLELLQAGIPIPDLLLSKSILVTRPLAF